MRLWKRRRPFLLAVIGAGDERRFIRWTLQSLIAAGAEVVVLDNDSRDGTRELAEEFLGLGLIRIERFPKPDGVLRWEDMLRRKQEVIRELRPRWAMHCDPDELRAAPERMGTLVDALRIVEDEGFNAVNFQEFTFVPTLEHPDHDHPRFAEMMHWYYPFLPFHPHRLTLFRPDSIEGWDFAASGGHVVSGDGVDRFPIDFPMRHYIALSRGHVDDKYRTRRHPDHEYEKGWHGRRGRGLSGNDLVLLPERCLRDVRTDGLDSSDPERRHLVFPI